MAKLLLRMSVMTVAAFALAPPRASGQAIFTFGFTDLNGVFDGASTWTTDASAISSGDVTRLVPTVETADFDSGFVGEGADFSLEMSLSQVNATTFRGTGSFVITDADGDTITGDFNGHWHQLSSVEAAFKGLISNAFLNGNTFNGTDGGSVNMDTTGVATEPLNGALIVLHAGGWFDSGAFTTPDTLVEGNLLPAPGAALLGLLGLGLAGAVRRRLA